MWGSCSMKNVLHNCTHTHSHTHTYFVYFFNESTKMLFALLDWEQFFTQDTCFKDHVHFITEKNDIPVSCRCTYA